MKLHRRALVGALPAVGGLYAAVASAQGTDAYPSRPVTIVVPFPAGGSADLNGRTVAAQLTAALGQSFIVENKAGAGGNVGTAFAARAPADGYTLLMSNSGALTVNPHLFSQVGYDALKDFAPISLSVKISNLLLVHPDLPVRSLPELFAYVKAKPGLLYGHSSGSKQLSGEVFRAKAGIDMPPVAYKGSAPMMADLLSGHIKIGFDEVLTSMPYIQAGKLIPIATTGAVRWPALPDVPTIAEQGGALAGYEVTGWFGLLAPAATPPALVNRLSETLQKAFADKAFRQRIYEQGSEPVGSSAAEFKEFVTTEYNRWGDLIRTVGIKIE
ncbi:Bug family tripartite tricarboxylate transporter substrate binding protein [Reyranella sp.]|uniref:Bug family tripartite tricarboxylate transporter substrate binding protein n=1 Tax=Reyranella sp. TaxID=1929291 RepID=UPI0037847C0C